jgi:hypothetical protein
MEQACGKIRVRADWLPALRWVQRIMLALDIGYMVGMMIWLTFWMKR